MAITKELYMKESNILAVNAIIRQVQRQVLFNTNVQNMKESNILACNAANNSLKREVLLNTKRQYMSVMVTNNLVGKSSFRFQLSGLKNFLQKIKIKI